MAIYEITSPSGQVLEIEGDSPPTEQDLDQIFKSVGGNTAPAKPQQSMPDNTQSDDVMNTPLVEDIQLNEDGTRKQVLRGGVQKTNFLGDLGKGAIKGVSSLGTRLGKNFVNKQIRPLLGKEPLSDEQLDKAYGFLDDKPEGVAENIGAFAGQVAPYMLLPQIGAGQGLGQASLNAASQGGLIGGLESVANNGIKPQNLVDAGLGAGIGGALPPVFRGGAELVKNGVKFLPQAGGFFAKSLGRIQPETLKRAVQPDSRALDLTTDTAQNLLMNTTEDVQKAYKNILDNAGREVNYAALRLPEQRGVFASSLKDSLDDIYAGYSTSGDRSLNPAYNNAGDIYKDINGLIEAAADKTNGGKISAPKLNDIMSNIKNYPIEWNKTTSKDRQAILKQVYGDYQRRLANLSPELRKANAAYSKLAKFDDNEGVRQIINPNKILNENIDSASRALKNYNSTVTKGNTNRNIQDLENILVENGYEPFLRKIDDVNAAMDLLNARTTGDSAIANLATNITKPALKAIRGYNRFVQKNPNAQKAITKINELREGLTPGLYNLLIQGIGRTVGGEK